MLSKQCGRLSSCFQRKPPPLHRALCRDEDEENDNSTTDAEMDSILNVEELATKRRVRKKDKMQRNALHVAVGRPTRATAQILLCRNPSISHTTQPLLCSVQIGNQSKSSSCWPKNTPKPFGKRIKLDDSQCIRRVPIGLPWR